MKKRILALFLAMVMVFGMLPVNAFAEEAVALTASLGGQSLTVESKGTYEDITMGLGSLPWFQVSVPAGTESGTALTMEYNGEQISCLFAQFLPGITEVSYYPSGEYGEFYAVKLAEDQNSIETVYCCISFAEACAHTETATAYSQVENTETHTVTVTCANADCGQQIGEATTADCVDEDNNGSCDLCGGAVTVSCQHTDTTTAYTRVENTETHTVTVICANADCGQQIGDVTTADCVDEGNDGSCDLCGGAVTVSCQHTDTTTAYTRAENTETHTVTVTCANADCGQQIGDVTTADCVDEGNDGSCDLCGGAVTVEEAVSYEPYTFTTGLGASSNRYSNITQVTLTGAGVRKSEVSSDGRTWNVILSGCNKELGIELKLENKKSNYLSRAYVKYNGTYTSASGGTWSTTVTPDFAGNNGTVSYTFTSNYDQQVASNRNAAFVLNLTLLADSYVNQAPQLIVDTPATADIRTDEVYSLDLSTVFSDPDDDTSKLIYSVSVDGAEAVATEAAYTYTPNGVETKTLVFTATDPWGAVSESYTVNLTVRDNAAPELTGDATASVDGMHGLAWTVDLTKVFTDADGDSLTYTVAIDAEDAISASASYSYTPAAAGTYTLVFRAADPKGALSPEYTVTLTAAENPAPTLSGDANRTASVDQYNTWSMDLSTLFADNEGDSLTYTVSVDGADAVSASSSYSYSANTNGTYTFVFQAADKAGNRSPECTVTLTVNYVPRTAISTNCVSVSGYSMDGYMSSVTVTGAEIENYVWTGGGNGHDETSDDDHTLYIQLSSDVADDATIALSYSKGGNTRVVTLTGDASVTLVDGEATVKVVSEFSRMTSWVLTRNYTIVFTNKANTAPVASPESAAVTVTTGDTYEVDLSSIFSDADGDALTYSLTADGETTAVDAAFSRTVSTSGQHIWVFTAEDSWGATATYTVTITAQQSDDAYAVKVNVPSEVDPTFFITQSENAAAGDQGETLTAVAGEGADGYVPYTVTVPSNVSRIAWSAEGITGMSAAVSDGAELTLVKTQFKLTALDAEDTESTLTVSYDGADIGAGTNRVYLLNAVSGYTYTATPAVSGYNTSTLTEQTPVNGEVVIEIVPKHFAVTAPAGSVVSAGTLSGSYNYSWAKAIKTETVDDTVVYWFAPLSGNAFIRVQQPDNPDAVTYWDYSQTLSDGKEITVTADMLFMNDGETTNFNSNTVYRNFEQYDLDLADIYMNINAQGYINLDAGSTKQLNMFRNWQAIESFTNSKIALPDFDYEIITLDGSNVISIEKDANNSAVATLTANSEGTAIVLVTYDAMYSTLTATAPSGFAGGANRYSAIWPDRTGVFVVSVGKDGTGITTNMTCNGAAFDAEHSPQFYTGTAGASVSFTPESGCIVTVARSTVGTESLSFGGFTDSGVEVNAETGEVTVTGLTTGRHIIRVEKDGLYTYQVVTAQQVTCVMADAEGNTLDESVAVKPGDTVTLTFTGVTNPAEKFATAYNYTATMLYADTAGNTYKSGSGSGIGTYNFSSSAHTVTVTVPSDWTEASYTLNGYITMSGMAAVKPGGHRDYAYGTGKGMASGESPAGLYLGTLPEIVLSVDTDNSVSVIGISLNMTETELTVGDTVTLTATITPEDATNQTVTWTSSDTDIASVTDGTVTALAAGEATVTAKAGDFTAECKITVTSAPEIAVTGITLNTTSSELNVGKTLTLLATVAPDNATDKTVIWTSDDESVATVTDGIVTAVAEGTVVITASAGDFSASCTVTVTEPEADDGKATVYFSVSNDAQFLTTEKGFVMAMQKLDVPYFDLAQYGLSEYSIPEGSEGYGKPTMLHLYLYATEILQYGVAAEDAGKGYLLENGIIGTDMLTVSGAAGSIFMEKFWNMSMNLNYYHNYIYPADDTGWGITADRVTLSDGDIVTIGHFTSWNFYSDPNSIFNYLVADGKLVTASAAQNKTVTLNAYRAGADMGNGGSNTQVEAELDIYYVKADALTSGDVTSWTKLGTTDAGGCLNADISGLGDGQYILAVAGRYGADYPQDIVSAPGGIILNVLASEGSQEVDNVIQLIDNIGQVTLDSEAAIAAARNAYNALSEDQQAAVTNYTKLTDAEEKLAQLRQEKADQDAADAVTARIDAIGTVTLDSKAAIDAARGAYDALTDAQKRLVSEETLKKLTDAEAAYAQLVATKEDEDAANAVEEQISAIGTVTLNSEAAVTAARRAYDALTDTQKQLVENVDVLIAAEQRLVQLKDEAAAAAVEEKITAIGTVTLDSEAAITAARAAYEALTDAQKALVENLAVLEAAEEALALLKLAGTDITDIYKTTGDYLAGLSAPTVASINGEWRVIGLARAGRAVADSYYDAVVEYVKSNIDENGRLHAAKSTDNSRIIVALTAIGKDVTDVGGYDLLSGLDEMSYIGNQGINGTIWALIAFDTHGYEIPTGDVTREKLVQTILEAQLPGGGWTLAGSVGDPDMTGMALQALAPYYGRDAAVKTAVDKALTWLSGIQNQDGTFSGSEGTTSESLSQIIVALTALGINPETDSRFVKNGVSAVDALSQFYIDGGGFSHGLTGDRNMMATEQGYYALVSYYRLLQGKTSLYDMSDVTIQTAARDQEAADAVEALIDAIGTVTQDSADAIQAARDAYDALTDEQKELVENYKTLTDAETAYAELVKTAEDEAAAKAVEEKIDAIGTVTLNSESKIKEARKAYDALTNVQKALVSNYATLTAAEEKYAALVKAAEDEAAANAVEKLIDAIGTVTKDSGEKINAARNAYDKLTEDQKALVENYKTLTDAESKYTELNSTVSVSFTLLGCYKHDSDEVHTLSGGNLRTWIGKKTYKVQPGATVKDVLEMALKEAGMSCVNPTGNYVESVNGIGEFTNGSLSGWMYTLNGTHPNLGVAEQTVKDGDVIVFHYTDDYTQEEGGTGFGEDTAIQKVEALIDAIGTVTLNSKTKIDAARTAYDNLTYAQKQEVSNYAKLTAAEAAYAKLKQADDERKANAVEALIDKIDAEITLDSEADITAARKAYDALSADQKKLVANYKTLSDAEYDLALLKADAADKNAAEAVEYLIDAIGTVTADSEDEIEAARTAYDKLTDIQKALVKNYADLEAAEERLAALKALADVEDIYKTTGDYLMELGTPVPGSVGGEWMVIGLLRSGREIENLDAYYDAAVKYVQENINENGRLHAAKSTDNSRLILALTAMGKDVTDVGGYDLLAGLNSMEYVQKQGINGPIWALLALDSGNYPAPEGDVSREALIWVILDAQLADGGWALSGTVSDADMTGMAVQALAPYYDSYADVKKALDTAVNTMSQMQAADGSFGSIDGTSSESIAQVIAALSAMGIDAHTDTRFIKNGISALDALCSFYVQGGGFRHIPTGKLDGMATEQSYYALTGYFRMLEGKTALFDMADVIDMGGDAAEEPNETQSAETEPAPTESVEDENDNKRSFPWWLVIVIVVLAGSLVVLVIISKPKKGSYVR